LKSIYFIEKDGANLGLFLIRSTEEELKIKIAIIAPRQNIEQYFL